jgi:single-stranded-DNA-specific exonuclease
MDTERSQLPRREWRLKPSESAGNTLEELQAETGLSPLVLRVCLQRGIDSAEKILRHLEPKLEHLTDPSKIKDMDAAVARLVQARNDRQSIRVFGDYDVDGTCGAALLWRFFEETGFDVDAVQPDRFKDGYGLNTPAVEKAHEDGVSLMVTIDCGITSFEPLARAQELGLDVIVVDHHQVDPKRGVPEAVAVVNPQRDDCESGLKQLCGCGLGFYLIMALRREAREQGWFDDGREPNLKSYLDLVVLATAADQVPLVGDNRILVRHGLQVLKHTTKPGLNALMQKSGLGARSLSPGDLGFTLGPRINASGRMASASTALELLCTDDAVKGDALAEELEKLNTERRDLQNAIWDEVQKQVEAGLNEGRFEHGIVVASNGWHEGVVGIVASRVTDRYHRPAVVLSIRDEEGDAKGSVRSWAGKNALEALRANHDLLLGYGGHKFAAGLSLEPEKIRDFADGFDRALAGISDEAELRPLWIEGECNVDDLDLQTLHELELLAPFGQGNPEPVFKLEAQVSSRRVLKGRHLKLNLSSVGSSERRTIEAIWFHAAERNEVMEETDIAAQATWAGVPELNRFRGRVTPTLRVRDWRPGHGKA